VGEDVAIGGWTVREICFGPRVDVVVGPDTDANTQGRIVLAGPATLALAGASHELDPAGPARALAPLLALYRREVATARVADDGAVEVAFADGAALTIRPTPRGRPSPRIEATWTGR
jgi:hypothetical protein